MSVLQISDDTGFIRVVPWQQVANALQPQQGLNMGSATWAVSTTRASTIIQPMVPMTCLFLCQLTSGTLTLNYSLSQGTPNYGSPTATVTISDTLLHVSPLLMTTRNDAQVSGGNPFVSVQGVTGSGSGAVIARACLLLLGAFPTNAAGAVNHGYHEAAFAINGLSVSSGGSFDCLLGF